MRGDRKAHRAHQVRRDPQPDVALGKRGAYAQKGPALQHGEIAMDQPGRGRGCAPAEIALFQQDHPQAASRGIARNADAVEQYRSGKTATFGYLVGQVMKAAGGRANPRRVNERLREMLDRGNS